MIGFDAEAVHREFGLTEDEVPVMLLTVGPEADRQLAAEAAPAGADVLSLHNSQPKQSLMESMMSRTIAWNPKMYRQESKPTLDAFTKSIGFTPNMMASFAQSPIAFNAWATLLGSLSKALDVRTRDSIGLAVSEVNGCNYCLTVHSYTAEHMAKLWRMTSFSPGRVMQATRNEDAAVQFARKSHRGPRTPW